MSGAFRLQSAALEADVVVDAFAGSEGISELYAIEIYWPGDEGASLADAAGILGAAATLFVDDDYAISGIIAEIEIVGRLGSRPLLCGTLVPRLWRLTQSQHSRVFTDLSLPEILETTLKGGGLPTDAYRLELTATYAAHDHVCQYRESDYDFLARWMEREGLYYFFEQADGAETLVITDDRLTHERFAADAIPYLPASSGSSTGPCLRSFHRERRVVPSKVALSDYDHLHPDAALSGSGDVDGGGGGIIHDHRGRFADDDRGALLATRWAEAIASAQIVYRADSTSLALRSGYLFGLDGHPESRLDGDYLVTRLAHRGLRAAASPDLRALTGIDIEGTYDSRLEAVASDIQYRSPSHTPWPQIHGFETAVIDGPADSLQPQIDEHGRYEVKLFFDESDRDGGKASMWLRRMQPYAGNPEGFHFPLRKGTEVMVAFLEGDPDRPVIAGAVPHATRPSPVTRANPRSNVIHTAGDNRVELGDEPGAQFISLSTPNRNTKFRLGNSDGEGGNTIVIHTEGDREEETEGDHNDKVSGKKEETIFGASIETILGFQTGSIVGLKTEQLAAGEIKVVLGAVSDTIVGAEGNNVFGGETKLVLGLFPIASEVDVIGVVNKNVLGIEANNVLGVETKFVGGGVQTTILGLETKIVGGAVVELIGGAVSNTVLGIANKNVLGVAVDTILGLETKGLIGGQVALIAPIDFKFVAGVAAKIVLGLNVEIVAGFLLSTEDGEKAETHSGPRTVTAGANVKLLESSEVDQSVAIADN